MAVVVLAVVAAACSAGPGAQAPSPKPYEQTFGPDYPAQPPAGQLTRVDDASISADGRTLTLGFTGGLAYTPADFCSTDYAPWAAAVGADLQVAVALVSHPDQATAPPNGACADVGHGYTFHLLLPAPASLPAGWQLRWSGDEPAAEPPLWALVYAPASSHVTGDNGGRGQLDLYQAFGAATQIGGGPVRTTVQVAGSPGVLLREPATGEMLLQWMVGPDGVALVGNEADMTLDQLLAIAAAVKPAGS